MSADVSLLPVTGSSSSLIGSLFEDPGLWDSSSGGSYLVSPSSCSGSSSVWSLEGYLSYRSDSYSLMGSLFGGRAINSDDYSVVVPIGELSTYRTPAPELLADVALLVSRSSAGHFMFRSISFDLLLSGVAAGGVLFGMNESLLRSVPDRSVYLYYAGKDIGTVFVHPSVGRDLREIVWDWLLEPMPELWLGTFSGSVLSLSDQPITVELPSTADCWFYAQPVADNLNCLSLYRVFRHGMTRLQWLASTERFIHPFNPRIGRISLYDGGDSRWLFPGLLFLEPSGRSVCLLLPVDDFGVSGRAADMAAMFATLLGYTRLSIEEFALMLAVYWMHAAIEIDTHIRNGVASHTSPLLITDMLARFLQDQYSPLLKELAVYEDWSNIDRASMVVRRYGSYPLVGFGSDRSKFIGGHTSLARTLARINGVPIPRKQNPVLTLYRYGGR